MLKIAICDDEMEICTKIDSFVLNKLGRAGEKCDISVYNSCERLLRDIQETAFDVIFLDIEFGKKIDGIQTGSTIRYEMKNEAVKIIYVSAKESYAMQLFNIRPFDFLVKPMTQEKIDIVIDKVLTLMPASTDFFKFSCEHSNRMVKVNDIIYFENEGRRINIITLSGDSMYFNGSLSDLQERPELSRFIDVHSSYFVNYDHIRSAEYENLTMVNGAVIPISQKKRKAAREIQFNLDRKGVI